LSDLKCKKILKNGKRCNAYAMKNKDFCFRHSKDPKMQKKAMIASRKGGLISKYNLNIRDFKGPLEARNFVQDLITQVLENKLPTKKGTSICYMLDCWLKLHNSGLAQTEFKEKLEELDQRLEKAGY
jgi:hypothetical protein